jgi:hypothetical protein
VFSGKKEVLIHHRQLIDDGSPGSQIPPLESAYAAISSHHRQQNQLTNGAAETAPLVAYGFSRLDRQLFS